MNSYNFSLSNNYFIIFLVIVIIVIFFLIFYNIIKPSKSTTSTYFNFQPYPDISPKDIPNNIIGNTVNSCYNKLTKCNLKDPANLQCNSCSGDFTCTHVDTIQGFNSNLKINNQDVPSNTSPDEGWCIPTIPEDFNCNSFTGKQVWSNDENCNNDHASSQCWSCECKYPDLFNGKGCSEQIACKAILDTANMTKDMIIGQSGNFLVSTQYNPLGQNIIYNPNQVASQMTPDEIKVLMEQSPYDSDANNKPYFSCTCGNYPCNTPEDCMHAGMPAGSSCAIPSGQTNRVCIPANSNFSTTYMNLENDPYMCHINPCGRINNFGTSNSIPVEGLCSNDNTKSCTSMTDCGQGAYCDFKCECPNGFVKINEDFNATKDNNTLYGTCITLDERGCNFNAPNKECICQTGYNRQCRSHYANINNPELDRCADDYNPIGYECFNPCPDKQCNYRGLNSYKIGKCKNTQAKCVSNSQCGGGTGDNICVYPVDCTCTCQNSNKGVDICDTLNQLYATGATGAIAGTGPSSLAYICNKYADICEMTGPTCVQKDLNAIKPFAECNSPYYGGNDCENLYCADNTNISCDKGTDFSGILGRHYFEVSKDKMYFCEKLKDKNFNDLSFYKGFDKDGKCNYLFSIDNHPEVGNAYCDGTSGGC